MAERERDSTAPPGLAPSIMAGHDLGGQSELAS
jgi:hypothetical protein